MIFSLRGNGNVEFIDISEESVPMLIYLSTIYEKLTGIHIAIYKEEKVKEGGKDEQDRTTLLVCLSRCRRPIHWMLEFTILYG